MSETSEGLRKAARRVFWEAKQHEAALKNADETLLEKQRHVWRVSNELIFHLLRDDNKLPPRFRSMLTEIVGDFYVVLKITEECKDGNKPIWDATAYQFALHCQTLLREIIDGMERLSEIHPRLMKDHVSAIEKALLARLKAKYEGGGAA